MTDKPAPTVGRKRRKYVPYNSRPQKGLNVDQPQNMQSSPAESDGLTLDDVVVLIRVVKEKSGLNDHLLKLVNEYQNRLIEMAEDIEYLKGELNNPNLFIAE